MVPPWAGGVEADEDEDGVAPGFALVAGAGVGVADGDALTAAGTFSKKMTTSKVGRTPLPQGIALRS